MNQHDDAYGKLLADKSEKLAELMQKKPGQKGYKRCLRAFLEADEASQQALLLQIETLAVARVAAPGADAAG